MISIKYIRSILFLNVCLALLFGLSCVKKVESESLVRIGVVAPYEGSNAHIGEMIMNSVKLYFEENNSEYYDVDLEPIDSKSNPSDVVAALQYAVADTKLVAVIGFYHSSTALAGKSIITEAQIPTIIYSASNPAVTENTSYYFRLVPTDDNQAIVLADYAKELNAHSAAILHYADEYGKGLADGIRLRATEIGLQIVTFQSYDATTTDFRPMLTVIKGKNPDVVFICGFVEKSIAILNQAVEKGLKSTFLAGDGTFNEEQLIQGAGANAEGVYVAAPYVFDETNEKNSALLSTYWEAYDKVGDRRKPASWSAFAYDAAAILGAALKNGHRNRTSIYQYLLSINTSQNGYDGITGLIFFDQKGDAVGKNFHLAVVKEGRFIAAQ